MVGHRLTLACAQDLLQGGLAAAWRVVGRLSAATLTLQEFDALVSIPFDPGSGALERSTLQRQLNLGDRAAAAQAPRPGARRAQATD
jgi:GH24 family phage-related lysozyme (muramidase)